MILAFTDTSSAAASVAQNAIAAMLHGRPYLERLRRRESI